MRFLDLLRLSPLAEDEPPSVFRLTLAAAPWAVVAIFALVVLAR
jgi:hypothetical protein